MDLKWTKNIYHRNVFEFEKKSVDNVWISKALFCIIWCARFPNVCFAFKMVALITLIGCSTPYRKPGLMSPLITQTSKSSCQNSTCQKTR